MRFHTLFCGRYFSSTRGIISSYLDTLDGIIKSASEGFESRFSIAVLASSATSPAGNPFDIAISGLRYFDSHPVALVNLLELRFAVKIGQFSGPWTVALGFSSPTDGFGFRPISGVIENDPLERRGLTTELGSNVVFVRAGLIPFASVTLVLMLFVLKAR